MSDSAKLKACWFAACLFCLVFYWPGVTTWFQRDDFGWLGLLGAPLGEALFSPKSVGTVRFLSERIYFQGLEAIFGLNALPFHLFAFLTLFASTGLLIAIVHRMTGSLLTAALAPPMWIINSTMAPVVTWLSGYNYVLCSFLILLSLWLLERYLETGKARYYAGQWLAFLAGFGANEMIIVYPAMALAYCWYRRRRAPWSVLALWLGSLAFLIVEFSYIQPVPRTGVYAWHLDSSMIRTFLKHWQSAAGPGRLYWLGMFGQKTGMWLSVAVAAGVLLHVWRNKAAFWMAWFVLAMAPFLPLRDQVTEYYPSVASLGLGVIAAGAIQRAVQDKSLALRAITAAWVGIYVASSLVGARVLSQRYHDDSMVAKAFVAELRRVDKLRTGTPIVIQSLRPAEEAAVDHAWRLLDIPEVRILPPADCAKLGVPVYWFDGRKLTEVGQ